MTVLLVIMVFYGVPIEAQETIKIGVIGPKGWIQWDGSWEGAVMARDKINDAGGVLGHNIELIEIDSHAVELNPSAGIAEMLTALDDGAQFLVGGFRTECVAPMREAAMDYAEDFGRPIWFIAGAATTELIDCGGGLSTCGKCVRCDYERYKYMFRATPMNGSALIGQIIYFLRTEVLPKLTTIYGSPVKTYIIAEDFTWCETMTRVFAGKDYYPEIYPGVPNPYTTPPDPTSLMGQTCEVVGVERPSPTATDFSGEFQRVEDDGARLIVHILSAVAGPPFIKQWGELEVNAVCVGINVESQMQEFYDSVEGKCEYEVTMATVGTRTPLTNQTVPFWDEYEAKFGHSPIYIAWGVHDAIMATAEAIEAVGTWPIEPLSDLIPTIEQSVRLGLVGTFKYTGPNGIYHDMYVHPTAMSPYWPEPYYVRSVFPQWQAGRLEPIWPGDKPYSKKYAMPPWMYPYSDVNYDGNVDIFDIVTTAGAFGTKPGDAEWDIRADLKKNDEIDIFDIVTIAADFGTTVPLPLP